MTLAASLFQFCCFSGGQKFFSLPILVDQTIWIASPSGVLIFNINVRFALILLYCQCFRFSSNCEFVIFKTICYRIRVLQYKQLNFRVVYVWLMLKIAFGLEDNSCLFVFSFQYRILLTFTHWNKISKSHFWYHSFYLA